MSLASDAAIAFLLSPFGSDADAAGEGEARGVPCVIAYVQSAEIAREVERRYGEFQAANPRFAGVPIETSINPGQSHALGQ